jgi:hypothetical protein
VKTTNNVSRNNSGDRNHPHDKSNHSGGLPFQPPQGGLEKSVAIESQIPSPGKDVEEKMGKNMPDRK